VQKTNDILEDDLPEGADRKTRVAIVLILLGLLNFLLFTVIYILIGGESINGRVRRGPEGQVHYYLKSWTPSTVAAPDGTELPGPECSRGVFVYSAVHSISVWPTVGMVMLAMLALAKDRVVSAMHSTIVRGRTFITILATIIVLMVVLVAIVFVGKFIHLVSTPEPFVPATQAARALAALGRWCWG